MTPNGSQGNLASTHPAISGDGSVVAFESAATNLTASCASDVGSQIFTHHRGRAADGSGD